MQRHILIVVSGREHPGWARAPDSGVSADQPLSSMHVSSPPTGKPTLCPLARTAPIVRRQVRPPSSLSSGSKLRFLLALYAPRASGKLQ